MTAGLAAAAFALTTLLLTFPLSIRLVDHVPENPGDPLLVAWILAWDVHALSTAPWRLFDANILYPLERTLAFSDHLLGVVPLFAVPYAVTRNPILALNVTILLSFVLCGLAMFLLVRLLSGSASAALLSGMVFAFAPARIGQLGHPQLLHFYWTPLALFFLERWFRGRTRRDLLAGVVCWIFQCLSSVYLAFLSTVVIGVYAAVRLLGDPELRAGKRVLHLGAAWCAAGVVVALVHAPYADVQRAWAAAWPADMVVAFSASPRDYVGAGLFPLLLGPVASRVGAWEKTVSLGVVASALVLAAAVLGRRDRVRGEGALWTVLAVNFVLSLGPVLIWADQPVGLPLPYQWLRDVVPGFSAMRVPARFGLAVSLAAAALAGLGALRLVNAVRMADARRRRRGVAVVVMVSSFAFVAETWRGPVTVAAVEVGASVAPVYRWLAARPDAGPLAEVPRGLWEDYRYVYYSTVHWRPLVNGSTGFVPGAWAQIGEYVDRLPEPSAAAALSAFGVREVVLHRRALSPAASERWGAGAVFAANLEEIARFDDDVVYRLPPVAPTGRVDAEASLVRASSRRVGIALALRGRGPGPWIHPRPLGQVRVAARWTCEGQEFDGEVRARHVIAPLLMEEGRVETYTVRVRRPPSSKACALTVGIPALGVTAAPVVVNPPPRERGIR